MAAGAVGIPLDMRLLRMYNRCMDRQKETAIKSVSIRIPVDVLAELHKVAKQHDRSLNGEVLTAIRDHIKKSQKEKR
jgi:tartrate dehydratase alpha subunit/fumarate hydratase class I-like protein